MIGGCYLWCDSWIDFWRWRRERVEGVQIPCGRRRVHVKKMKGKARTQSMRGSKVRDRTAERSRGQTLQSLYVACLYMESGRHGSIFYKRWLQSAGVGAAVYRTDWGVRRWLSWKLALGKQRQWKNDSVKFTFLHKNTIKLPGYSHYPFKGAL